MTDRRFLAANQRVALASLEGEHEAPRYSKGRIMRISIPVSDLLSSPDGARDKQLLFGQPFRVLEVHEGWAFGFDEVDGYVGYLRNETLSEDIHVTHRVGSRATHVYSEPTVKSRESISLPFFAEVAVILETNGFAELATGGFIPCVHLVPLSWRATNPVVVAAKLLGTPYLWGGDSAFGIDCSGLTQLAFHAVGRGCPRDSDLQAARLGEEIDLDAPRKRGDLYFWKGHVGLLSDPDTLLHANAHAMMVAEEPLEEAISRIAAKEGNGVLCRRRVSPPVV